MIAHVAWHLRMTPAAVREMPIRDWNDLMDKLEDDAKELERQKAKAKARKGRSR